jgi:hypothetical protein
VGRHEGNSGHPDGIGGTVFIVAAVVVVKNANSLIDLGIPEVEAKP